MNIKIHIDESLACAGSSKKEILCNTNKANVFRKLIATHIKYEKFMHANAHPAANGKTKISKKKYMEIFG